MKIDLYRTEKKYDDLFEYLNYAHEHMNDNDFNNNINLLLHGSPLAEKLLNIAAHYKNIQKEAELMKKYEEDMKERRTIVENKCERYKKYIQFMMEASNTKKINGVEINITLRSNAPKVIVDDVLGIPEEYVDKKTQIIPDKNKIKDAIKEGVQISGVHLEESRSIIIK